MGVGIDDPGRSGGPRMDDPPPDRRYEQPGPDAPGSAWDRRPGGLCPGPGRSVSPMITYELWTHRWTATYYAIRLCEGHITGVCGPLPESARTERGDLAVYDYDDRPEVLRRARRNPDQF